MSPARQLAATRPSGTGRHVRVTPPITPPPPPPPTDPLAPVITSGPTVSSITDTTASIRWDLSEPCTGFIEYGTTISYGTESAHETSFNWSYHIQSLSGLSPATIYHFRVRSTNSLGLEVISADTTFTTTGAPPPPPAPGTSGVYGTFFSTGVGNYRLWQGAYGTFRFRAETDSYLQSIRWYETTGAGYSAGSTGDMGNIVFSLRADDGTTLHNPSSTVLSSCAVYHGTSAGGGGILSTFTVPYRVTAGQLYHIQFENTHSDSVNHHDSVNCLVQVPNNDPADPYPDVSPGEPNPRWGPGALEMGAPNYVGGWATEAGISQRPAYWPIMDLTFSDGHHQGQGYMQLEDAFNFSGNTQVRQKMTISGGDKTVTGVILMLEHKVGTGTSPAIAYLENSSNQVMDQVSFPASDWPDGPATRGVNPNPFQVERPFAHSNLLVNGQTYYLRLATASGTTYMTEAIQNGVSYGYHPSLSFPDGVRQTTTGGAGGSWTTQVVTDMQFYMRLAGASTPPPPPPTSTNVYGVAFADDALQNLNVGQHGDRYAFRFKAEQTLALNSITIYIIGTASGNPGDYALGDGGLIRCTLRTVDSNLKPTTTILATATSYTCPPGGDAGKVVTFPSPYTVTAGTRYALVFDNIHGTPLSNYSAVDTGQYRDGPKGQSQVQPKFADADWRTLYTNGNNENWVEDGKHSTPICCINYAGGATQGQGYMETRDPLFDVTGNKQIRERFTVTGGNRSVTGLWVRLARLTGTSALTCRLETSAGAEVVTVSIPASNWATAPYDSHWWGQDWGFASLGGTFQLTNNTTYNLKFSTATGTTYWTGPMLKGDAWYASNTYFNDGRAQYTNDASSWSDMFGTRGDLQFYFEVGASTPVAPGVSNVVISSLTDTGFAVDWDVSPAAYGRLQWSTSALANPSTNGTLTAEQVSPLTHHHMVVAGAPADTLIHFRIWTDATGTGTADATQKTSVAPAPPPPTQTGSALVYGTVHSNGTGNIRLWDDSPWCSYRWRAPFTKYVRSVRWYHVWDVPGQYSLGDPTAIITLNPDNPASTKFLNFNDQNVVATNQPVHTTVLSSTAGFSPNTSYFLGPQGNGNPGSVNDFITPYQVTAGQLYHIKFINTSSDTHNNNFSTDMTVNEGRRLSAKWGAGNLDMGIVHNGEVDSGIAHRPGYLPTFDISFSDTASGSITGHWGDGYIYLEDPMTISGNTQVRERFTVSGGTKTVVSVIPNLYRVSGTSPLIATLENASGGILDQVSFPYTDFATFNPPYRACRPIWVERNFSAQQTITNGTTYSLRFSTASGTTYEMVEYEKGNGSNYGYHPSVSFGDGHVQTTTGGASGSWSDGGAHLVSDAQWFMRLA